MKVCSIKKHYVGVRVHQNLKRYLEKRAEREGSTINKILNDLIMKKYGTL
jgi:hypothetical protein